MISNQVDLVKSHNAGKGTLKLGFDEEIQGEWFPDPFNYSWVSCFLSIMQQTK